MVIAIIGLLSSVVLASLNTARVKARDARRVSDGRQLELAIQLYRDANGAYPSWSYMDTANATFISAMAPYISAPTDPQHGASGAFYFYAYATPAWISGNSWSKLTHDCDNKHVLVIRQMENAGAYRQDCALSDQRSMSITFE